MGWLDIVLLVIIAVAGIGGMRLGLIRAAFIVVGLLIGCLVAGQFSDDLGRGGGRLDVQRYTCHHGQLRGHRGGVALVAAYAVKIARPMLSLLTMGFPASWTGSEGWYWGCCSG